MVNHSCCRLRALRLFFLPVVTGTILNGFDDAGQCNLHRRQQHNNCSQSQQYIRQQIATSPSNAHSQQTADQTAAGAVNATHIQIRNQFKTTNQRLIIDNQMMNGTGKEHKENQAGAAHPHRLALTGYQNQEQIKCCRNGKIETDFTHQACQQRQKHPQ